MSFRHGELPADSAVALRAPTELAQPAATRMFIGPEYSPMTQSLINGRSTALPSVRLRGVNLHAITEAGCIQHIMSALEAGRGGVVVTPNLDHLRRCLKDVRFGALVTDADLVVADGMPLIWASRLQGTPLPERVAGSDLISSLSAAAAERGRSVYLLGGDPGTADGAAEVLRRRHPTLKVAGTHCPPMGFEQDESAIRRMTEEISASRPDIVYVGLGSPKQELLIERLRGFAPGAWWLGVGNSFSFLCGQVPRAPLWMQKSGLEWVHRLVHEPRRLFKRYVISGLPFAATTFASALGQRVSRRLSGKQEPASAGEQDKLETHDDAPAAPTHAGGNGHSQIHRRNGVKIPPRPARPDTDSSLHRLRGLILLGGQLRATSLRENIGRSVLDLPVDERGSILDHWYLHAEELVKSIGVSQLPIRVLVDQSSPRPTPGHSANGCRIEVEADQSEYRGTGGVLGDLARDYEPDDMILVANAAQILLEPLTITAAALERTHGDVALVSHDDGTPGGLMLLSGGALRLIPRSGFVDLKEQALPMIASSIEVGLVRRDSPTALPIRSVVDYVTALRRHHELIEGRQLTADPLAEGWRPVFSVAEPGSTVDPQARIHDSVVLRGGRVESGAVLVRSVVCDGGVVRRDRSAVDQLVTIKRK